MSIIAGFLCCVVATYAVAAFVDMLPQWDGVPLWAHDVDDSVDAETVLFRRVV
jgi:hypothetical protein